MVIDVHKMTRKKYRAELRAPVSPSDLHLLTTSRTQLMNFFTEQMINYAEESDGWASLVAQAMPSMGVGWKVVRVFVLQTMYALPSPQLKRSPSDPAPTPPSKKTKPIIIRGSDEESHSDSDSDDNRRVIVKFPGESRSPADRVGETGLHRIRSPMGSPANRAVRKSVQPRHSFILTSFGEADSEGEFVYSTVSGPADMKNFQEVISTVDSSGLDKKIIIKRCTCGFSDGTASECSCRSMEGQYLVPRQVIRSRQVKTAQQVPINATEFLVAWRPFDGGKEWPASWIPLEPLVLWRSGVLMDYLVSRIQFAR